MKSIGGVAVLHPQDSTPHKPHSTINFHHPFPNSSSSSPAPNFTNGRRRTPARGIHKKKSETVGLEQSGREFFAGSVFVESPPPSSVPMPGFFARNFVSAGREDPTTELRRILGLDLS